MTLTKISRSAGYKIEFIRTYDTFLECFVENDSGETVKMDFAHDTPYRSKPTVQHAPYTMSIDNLLDIACNKLSALFDRAEPKDFVDVYFVCRDFMSLAELIESTRQKHVGIDNYWLAQAFERVRQVNFLPRMIKPLELEVLRSFFLEEASRLIDNIDPA
ncbi:MAG: nucleotidyl transferase AbiEii/AbiGii toxin family protein [Candidatus Promineifilaceae bacterium]|nr:nucleotidyl transferase AbiEii/AbiGii toxin family protein [Candidatus Promineifilaceae bacterium]